MWMGLCGAGIRLLISHMPNLTHLNLGGTAAGVGVLRWLAESRQLRCVSWLGRLAALLDEATVAPSVPSHVVGSSRVKRERFVDVRATGGGTSRSLNLWQCRALDLTVRHNMHWLERVVSHSDSLTSLNLSGMKMRWSTHADLQALRPGLAVTITV
jgi:hypothetical protein